MFSEIIRSSKLLELASQPGFETLILFSIKIRVGVILSGKAGCGKQGSECRTLLFRQAVVCTV